MGVFFMLGVGFPVSAARELEEATRLASDAQLQVRDATLTNGAGSSRMRRNTRPDYFEFTSGPAGFGYPSLGHPLPFRMSEVTSDDLYSLAEQLYGLLRQMTGYAVAHVGWDPEWVLDLAELESEDLENGALYDIAGLVLAEPVVNRWQLDERFEPFAEGYRWLPPAAYRAL